MNKVHELHAHHRGIVEALYEKNITKGEINFDAYPTLLALVGDALGVLVLSGDGSPLNAASEAVRTLPEEPSVVSFMSPAWTKDPKTREVVGEVIMLVTESKLERATTMLKLTRTPYSLVDDTPNGGAEMMMRINLLYQPTPPTEH